ncbi:FAD-dependent monooxygenase [Neorickettsia findlayensis]|uniref:Ubiquinone biosynthesis protein UbiH n=1 Tax=Neorickettsia findlayensis TaxID=2686014 RepID=A0A6P1G9J5_9RICK|nr:FAD-dependent monooxygenase [Neorickettsia findlayensis]QHD65137.1 ubiquinone biosynthesis protein UbiH [Neorickettsia findlayensis]
MTKFYDFIISGAGLSGVLAAHLLKNLGLSYYIFDKSSEACVDFRTSAISCESVRFFETLGLWQMMESFAVPINDIYTFQEKSGSFLHFEGDNAALDFSMSYVVPNLVLQDVLYKGIDINYGCTYKSVCHSHDRVRVDFPDKVITGRYMLVAEGRYSNTAGLLGFKMIRSSYRQSCLICNLRSTGREHSNVAVELFLEGGPFALLPLRKGTEFSLIWTVKFPFGDTLAKIDEKEFLSEVRKISGIEFEKILTPRMVYPIVLNFCMNPRKGPVMLIGDSAHGIHPVAGQGFNLAIYDLKDLHDVLNKYGLDNFDELADAYLKRRKRSALAMVAFTHFLVKSFSCASPSLRAARSFVLDVIESSTRLKRFFMERAAGKGL